MVTCGKAPANGPVACYTTSACHDWIWKALGNLFQGDKTSAGRGKWRGLSGLSVIALPNEAFAKRDVTVEASLEDARQQAA